MLVLALAFLLVPVGSAWADPTDEGEGAQRNGFLESVCPGEPAPYPEISGNGPDGELLPPQSRDVVAGSPDGLQPDQSLYGQYGTSGLQWHVVRENCMSKMGSSAITTLTNTTWDLSKTINQSTITVYQAATSDGLLANFNRVVEDAVAELREGIWRPLLPTVFILGAVWLGWYGLIRKRVTLTIESAVWMVLATALGLWILVNPGQILGLGAQLVNSGGQLINTAVSRVPSAASVSSCPAGAPAVEKAEWESENDFAARKNSQMLWSTLLCQPWVAGQFGSGKLGALAEQEHGVALIGAQAFSRDELTRMEEEGEDLTEARIEEKQEEYSRITEEIRGSYPEVAPIYEGNQQSHRFGVAVLALFSAVFAGGLILAGSVALIVLKIGFLLMMLLSPVFLLIGIHPGYGRSVLLRWGR
ncbi:hypothetical protein ACFQXA_19145 [Nocardiopsis composta]